MQYRQKVHRAIDKTRSAMSSMPRVNASMLPDNVEKRVCLVGQIKQVNPTGDKLQLLSCDEQLVNIVLKDKYEDKPGECVQIIGTVKPDLTVEADKYIIFSGTDCDYELYNSLITKYLPRFPHLFQLQESTTTDNDMNDWD